MLESVRLPDSVIADIIYDLSHTRSARKGDSTRSFVNYRDMSVQQLGSIYERLLEQEPVRGDDGKIGMRPNPYARKDSGSFYTPQELVDLIVEKTLAPLVEERLTAFEIRAEELKKRSSSQAGAPQGIGGARPGGGGARPEDSRSGHGQRPLPGDRRGLSLRRHRPHGRVSACRAGVAERRLW